MREAVSAAVCVKVAFGDSLVDFVSDEEEDVERERLREMLDELVQLKVSVSDVLKVFPRVDVNVDDKSSVPLFSVLEED